MQFVYTWLMNINGWVVLDLSRRTKGDVMLEKKLVVYLYSLTLSLYSSVCLMKITFIV